MSSGSVVITTAASTAAHTATTCASPIASLALPPPEANGGAHRQDRQHRQRVGADPGQPAPRLHGRLREARHGGQTSVPLRLTYTRVGRTSPPLSPGLCARDSSCPAAGSEQVNRLRRPPDVLQHAGGRREVAGVAAQRADELAGGRVDLDGCRVRDREAPRVDELVAVEQTAGRDQHTQRRAVLTQQVGLVLVQRLAPE
ncbi:MAG: hypothetical protein QOJ25_3193 [Solirubrobacteraceae bacterium]|jgi:hypothetical protein|nr:hypothetical protein [Solirubrobacteraceae bacterium]